MPDQHLMEFINIALHDTIDALDGDYSGALPLGITWALTFSKHRESHLLAQSNFDTIYTDLVDRFPSDVAVVHTSYHRGGYRKTLALRLLDDESHQPTEAAIALLEWVGRIGDEGAADTEDLGYRTWETAIEDLPFYVRGVIKRDAPADWRQQIVDRMDNAEVMDDGSLRLSPDPTEIARELGLLEPDGEE